jgi:hypothetical protein
MKKLKFRLILGLIISIIIAVIGWIVVDSPTCTGISDPNSISVGVGTCTVPFWGLPMFFLGIILSIIFITIIVIFKIKKKI